jgi:serine protease AprX
MTMKSFAILLFSFFSISASLFAQNDKDLPQVMDTLPFYWVTFMDKADSPYSIKEPTAFLSEKAIERRKTFNIPVTEEDFPPNPQYLNGLKAKGARILHSSRWMNTATATILEDSLSSIKKLPYVKDVQYVGIQVRGGAKFSRTVDMDSLMTEPKKKQPYGYGFKQIEMINGDALHQIGYTGKGVTIAVLDGGFTGVDKSPFFSHLRSSGRMLPGVDFVDMDSTVFESSSHGTRVLSTMAAKLPNLFIGSAPDASYVCIKTEDVSTENLLEECHWVAGIEYADWLGADIVTSSLGYTRFDDTTHHHSYEQLDGKTAIASRAAAIASKKGMLVLNSAGNEGNGTWRYIGIPADPSSTLTVGATTLDGKLASFSSVGPTADGRIKPDVVAPGARVTLADAYNFKISRGSGTSFSTPLVAGMVACLKQAFPKKYNKLIIKAIQESGSIADEPNNEYGYGLPDFLKAYESLQKDIRGIERQPVPATSGDKQE